MKSPKFVYKFNPIRSTEAITEFDKKRWVSSLCLLGIVCNLFIFVFKHPGIIKSKDQIVPGYNRWRSFRSEIRPIDQSVQDASELQADLCDFIVKIRKENGEQYPPSSMYDLISGLSLCLEREYGYENKFVSGAFRLVRNTFDNIMKERTAEGVGGGLKGNPF